MPRQGLEIHLGSDTLFQNLCVEIEVAGCRAADAQMWIHLLESRRGDPVQIKTLSLSSRPKSTQSGLVNYQGIPKPAFHACRMPNSLGSEVLARVDGAVATRESTTGRWAALIYNYPAEVSYVVPSSATIEEADTLAAIGRERQFDITLTGLRPGA